MLKKISIWLSVTDREIYVIIFILSAFAAGFLIKMFSAESTGISREFDYSYQDSIFTALGIIEDSENLLSGINEKKVDYKQEVLDFNGRDFKKSKTDSLPAEKSINLNSASSQDLMRLPGIGEKTAENIIEFRNSRGGFKTVNQLLEIKGIGQKKLKKIEKYIFIDKTRN